MINPVKLDSRMSALTSPHRKFPNLRIKNKRREREREREGGREREGEGGREGESKSN